MVCKNLDYGGIAFKEWKSLANLGVSTHSGIKIVKHFFIFYEGLEIITKDVAWDSLRKFMTI